METHQLLCLRAEEGIDTDDEGGGGAQDLQQFPRQDGNVGKAERDTNRNDIQHIWHMCVLRLGAPRYTPEGSGEGQRRGSHLYLRGNMMASSPRQASVSLW